MDENRLVLVARFPTAYKAHIAKGRLEAKGLTAWVTDELAPRRGLVGVGLLVPASQAEEAKRILDTMPGLFNFLGI